LTIANKRAKCNLNSMEKIVYVIIKFLSNIKKGERRGGKKY
jgi:hypothetical protein